MSLTSKVLMSDSGLNWNYESLPERTMGYYKRCTSKGTVQISTHNFVGRINLYGTLEDSPEEADKNNGWVLLKLLEPRYNNIVYNIYPKENETEFVLGLEDNYTIDVYLNGILLENNEMNYTITNGILVLTNSPAEHTLLTIYVHTARSNMNISLQEDYTLQLPLSHDAEDDGPIHPSPIYGPRTTKTFIGEIQGNYTFMKGEVQRDYIKEDTVNDPIGMFDKQSVGAVSFIKLNY